MKRAPRGIQLRRTKGWRKPEGAIVVSRPTHWGNPYRVGDDLVILREGGVPPLGLRVDAELAVALYRKHALEVWGDEKIREALAGHDLACWCPLDAPCHRDVLLELANPRTRGRVIIDLSQPPPPLGGGYLGPPPPGMAGAIALSFLHDRQALQNKQAHR